MRARWLAVSVLALAGALAGPAAGSAGAGPAAAVPRVADVAVVPEHRYVRDVVASARALLDLARVMQDADDLEAFREDWPRAARALERFRQAVERMGTYRLAVARTDRQRAALARTGPPLARALTRFLAAARRGDAHSVRKLLPGVQRSVARFQQAGRPVR
jgi:hypothetical protein